MDALRDDLVALLEPGPAYFPEGVISDQTDEARVGEAVREAALEALRDEMPHAVAVRIEEIVPGRRGVTVVRATIICETDSQKRIVVGRRRVEGEGDRHGRKAAGREHRRAARCSWS